MQDLHVQCVFLHIQFIEDIFHFIFVQMLHVRSFWFIFVHMTNIKRTSCTTNSEHLQKWDVSVVDRNLTYLPENERVYALNLLKDWKAQQRHLIGNDKKTIKLHEDNLERLLRRSGPTNLNR